MLFNIEYLHDIASGEAGKFAFDVGSLATGLIIRHVAGATMLSIGIWYLGFGTRWIAWYHGEEDGNQYNNWEKHIITGIQVLSGWIPLTLDRAYRPFDDVDTGDSYRPAKQEGSGLWKSSFRMVCSWYIPNILG